MRMCIARCSWPSRPLTGLLKLSSTSCQTNSDCHSPHDTLPEAPPSSLLFPVTFPQLTASHALAPRIMTGCSLSSLPYREHLKARARSGSHLLLWGLTRAGAQQRLVGAGLGGLEEWDARVERRGCRRQTNSLHFEEKRRSQKGFGNRKMLFPRRNEGAVTQGPPD